VATTVRSFWLASASIAAIAIGAFGPWATKFGLAVNSSDDELVGIVALIAALALAVLALTRNVRLASLPLLAGLFTATVVGHDLADPAGPFGGPGPNIHIAWGAWATFAGSIGLVVASLLLLVEIRSEGGVLIVGRRTRRNASPPEANLRAQKWWQHERTEAGSQSHGNTLQRLERTNANALIAIETVVPRAVPAKGKVERSVRSAGIVERFVDAAHARQYERFLEEEHHRQYGSPRSPSPWALGKCIFESLVAAGVGPEHRVLDFACGALRLGRWLIPYLDQGNYFGVDSHLASLEAATTYEIPLNGLERKRPRLLWNDDVTLSHFGTTFDWIVDYNGSRRLQPKALRVIVYERFARVLNSGGRLLTSPHPAVPVEAFADWGLVLSRRWVADDCPFLVRPFKLRWWEFVRT
jgi:SAM-dependent methyltransferase